MLCDAFINQLPYTNENVINKYTKQISTELYNLSKEFEANGDTSAHVNARCEINKKYGKFWRERLNLKKTNIMKNKNFILGTLILGAFLMSIGWVVLEAIFFILRLIFNL